MQIEVAIHSDESVHAAEVSVPLANGGRIASFPQASKLETTLADVIAEGTRVVVEKIDAEQLILL